MSQEKADILIRGGKYFLGRQDLPAQDVGFVAIRDKRILATGRKEEAEAYIGEGTKVYDLPDDRLVMPGLHDNHIHLIQAGLLEKYLGLYEAANEEEAATMVGDFAKAHPEEEWIIGMGWSKYAFGELPTAASLDALVPDRPVVLLDDECHAVWANSKALEIAGINKDTPDVPMGEIARYEDGTPTGHLNERALCLVLKYAFDFTPEQVAELVELVQKKFLSMGVTSVSDMTPYLVLDLSYPDAYMGMAESGKLRMRVNAALDLFGDIGHAAAVRDEAEKRGQGIYRAPFLKQFVDGVPGNYTGYMLEDYANKPGERGGTFMDRDGLHQAVAEGHAKGLSIRLHACGDAAIRMALDAYEAAITADPKAECHHQVEHIEIIDPADISRFGKLGVIASIQPEHIVSGMPSFSDNDYPDLLGPEREANTWAFRRLKDAGAVLACGSDCPVVLGNPFVGMYSGLERIHDDGTPAGGWNPKEKLTIGELLEGYTYGAAYGEGRGDELGTLEAGKLADVAVVDRNLLSESSERIRDAKVQLTIVNGNVEYDDGTL